MEVRSSHGHVQCSLGSLLWKKMLLDKEDRQKRLPLKEVGKGICVSVVFLFIFSLFCGINIYGY